MNLSGVSTLFITPRLRSSDYVSLLGAAIPSITANRTIISDAAAPSLRNLVLVDNLSHNGIDFANEKTKLPVAIDYRELLVWREDDSSKAEVNRLANSLDNNDVINLQFTRWVHCLLFGPLRDLPHLSTLVVPPEPPRQYR